MNDCNKPSAAEQNSTELFQRRDELETELKSLRQKQSKSNDNSANLPQIEKLIESKSAELSRVLADIESVVKHANKIL
jgi:cell division septum initiation protein DivIVA